ncbi:unnamed protein product [Lupinus luteus]|uniref:ENTH domain-containing protein n=1 Tax=Lupinus luteus TaxID=3873 RepID=A0AAV1XFA9_LUPLU
MGTFSFKKAYDALKDSTKVGLAKVNSEYKGLDIAIVKATNHVEYPPKERHVAVKTLIVIHRTLREGDPTFREELLNYSQRGHILQISNFKDDSSTLAWDCSAWLRQAHSRTRSLANEDLLEQLPALQQLLYRLIGCQPEGSAYGNFLIQYASALFFDMSRHDAVKALNIYKRAGKQAENLADYYEYCKGLDLARNFQFPTLRQPPPSFLATMEEYIKEAPQTGSVNKRLEYKANDQSTTLEESSPKEPEKPLEKELQDDEVKEEVKVAEEEKQPKQDEVEPPPLISMDTVDLLGLNEINPKALELEDRNALALAIVPPGGNNPSNLALCNIDGTAGWELALVTTPSNHTSQAPDRKLGGGFDKLLLDSLYEDDTARRQLQLQNAGYGHGGIPIQNNPFDQYNHHDPFAVSNNIAPPPNVQMALMSHQQMMFQQQQQQNPMMFQQQQQQHTQYHPQYMQMMGTYNPFGDPLPVPSYPNSTMPQQGNYSLI